MGEKKVVSRKVVVGISVLSIVLLVVLCGILEYQIVNLQSQLSSDKSTINSLNTTISNLERAGFSVIQISDTQYLSDSQPDLYDGLTSWIADKANALNLTMVVHTGDIVQVANSVSDWKNASNAMMTLYNNEIPY